MIRKNVTYKMPSQLVVWCQLHVPNHSMVILDLSCKVYLGPRRMRRIVFCGYHTEGNFYDTEYLPEFGVAKHVIVQLWLL